MPHELKANLQNHDVSHVEDEGWRSIKKWRIIAFDDCCGLEVLITRDNQIQYQQNFKKHLIPVIILRAKELDDKAIIQFAPLIIKLLKGRLKPGPHQLTLD